jgi:lysophospholipase L1-like esterase
VSLKGPGKRSAVGLVLLLLVASTFALAVRAASGAPDAPSYYVSLGDSLARGWQPGSDGHSRDTNQGYVDDVASSLASRHLGLATVKLGCAGETSGTMLAGGICHYAHGSELGEAEAFLRAHKGKIAAVTVNIGDNDVEQCLVHSHIDSACVNREMAGVQARVPKIAQRLRAAAGKGVPIVGLTDYDQFLAYWLSGAAGQRLAKRSVRIIGRLNRAIDAIYAQNGVRVADASRAFSTSDLTHFTSLRGHGRVPVAVARVCRWTWACSGPPIGFNDHANATGYRVLGKVILKVLRGA